MLDFTMVGMESVMTMNVSHKSSNTQFFRLMVYRRALHPELLDLQARRLHKHGGYEVECWLAPAGHVVRFQHNGHIVTEAVVENADHLPELGLIHALPCLGEKEYDMEIQDNLGYVTTIQTEALTENLYMATYREMMDFAAERQALHYEWRDSDGNPCLSLMDTQKFKREFHVQNYHMLGSASMVLRTQSIFEVVPETLN